MTNHSGGGTPSGPCSICLQTHPNWHHNCAGKFSDDGECGYIRYLERELSLAHSALAEKEREGDTKRLDYLESLTGRMYCAPNGKIWPLPSELHLTNMRDVSATLYLRDHMGRNAQSYKGGTIRQMIDVALAAPSAGGEEEK